MRAEYLKELELLPLWTLRKPLPGLQDAAVDKVHIDTQTAEGNKPKQVLTPSAVTEPLNVMVYVSDDKCLQLVHAAECLDGEQQQLAQNIATSMRLRSQSIMPLQVAMQQDSANVWLILGEPIAQAVLSTQQDLHALRAQVHQLGDKQVVVTDGLAQMLAQPKLKATVWKDCCLAMSLLAD